MLAVFYMSRLFTVEASEPENKLKIIKRTFVQTLLCDWHNGGFSDKK